MYRRKWEVASLLLHLLEELSSVYVHSIDSCLLVEHVEEEADPCSLAVLGTTHCLFEGGSGGVHCSLAFNAHMHVMQNTIDGLFVTRILFAVNFTQMFFALSVTSHHH